MEGAETVLLRASLEKIPGVACFVLDRSGRYVASNAPHCELVALETGRTPEAGDVYLDVLSESGRPCRASNGCDVRVREHRTALARALEGAAATARLGSAFPVSVALSPVLDASGGSVVGVLGVHDRLPPVHRPEDAQPENRDPNSVRAEMARLADGILNELNNLGVGLGGAKDTFASQRPSVQAVTELMDAVRERADAARRLTRAIRSHVLPAPLEELDADVLLAEIESQLRSAAPAATVVIERGAQQVQIRGDREELADAIGELVRNAAEAAARRITVRTRTVPARGGGDRPELVIEVVDDGEGMDEERRRRVFEVYLGSRRNSQGIGLTWVRSIVRRHGGAIGVDSSPRVGTQVAIRFPLASGTPVSAGPTTNPGNERPQLDVFVVDDAPEVRRVLGRVLRHGGHRVSEAEDGIDALEKLEARNGRPDVVVLDLMMPRMDGVETYRALRAQTSSLPILITSGYHPSSLGFLATDRWARFLAKPFSPSEVLTALDDLMNG